MQLYFQIYVWVVPLKHKKGVTIVDAFQKILDDSTDLASMELHSKTRKSNKIWVDKVKKWLKNNDIEMYSTHSKGKSVAAERFIRTLKSKIYKYMTSVSKHVYIDKLDNIVNEYNNTYIEQLK